jgi:hypothetical protein
MACGLLSTTSASGVLLGAGGSLHERQPQCKARQVHNGDKQAAVRCSFATSTPCVSTQT